MRGWGLASGLGVVGGGGGFASEGGVVKAPWPINPLSFFCLHLFQVPLDPPSPQHTHTNPQNPPVLVHSGQKMAYFLGGVVGSDNMAPASSSFWVLNTFGGFFWFFSFFL